MCVSGGGEVVRIQIFSLVWDRAAPMLWSTYRTRITEIPEARAMHRTAAHRDLMLVGRRHVDLLRVSSAICRSFC
jgi:hypothetical protein